MCLQVVEVGEVCEHFTIQQREDGDDLEVDVDSQSAVLDEDMGATTDNNGIQFEESADGYVAEQEGVVDNYEEVCVVLKAFLMYICCKSLRLLLELNLVGSLLHPQLPEQPVIK